MTRPTRLVLLSSEQLMPSIESLMLMLVDPAVALVGVHIYYTDDEPRSGRPARALAEFIRALRVPLLTGRADALVPEVVLPELPGDVTPQAVKAWVEGEIGVHPRDDWVINITGGLKLMALSLPDMLCSSSQVSVRYCERAFGWYSLSLPDDQLVATLDTHAHHRASALVDQLDIGKLTLAQLGGSAAQVSIKAPEFRQLAPLARIAELTEALATSRWDYGLLRTREMGPPDASNGILFEHFVGTVLHLLGAGPVVVGLEASRFGHAVVERDVVCLHGGKLWFIDCKLTKGDDPGAVPVKTQLRDCVEAMHLLGGLNASLVMLRPNWNAEVIEQVRQAAGFARGVEVWGQGECARLAQSMATWLKLTRPLLPELLHVDRILQADNDAWGYTLCGEAYRPRSSLPAANNDGMLNLSEAVCSRARQAGRNWAVVQFIGWDCLLVFDTPIPDEAVAQPMEHCLRAAQAPPMRLLRDSSHSIAFRIVWPPGFKRKQFVDRLARESPWMDWPSRLVLRDRMNALAYSFAEGS